MMDALAYYSAGNKQRCLKIKGTDRNVVRLLLLFRRCFTTTVLTHNHESGRKSVVCCGKVHDRLSPFISVSLGLI